MTVLKLADVSPIFKKEDSFKRENYRPVTILPHICQKSLKGYFINKLILS